jgi:hypothetical protein
MIFRTCDQTLRATSGNTQHSEETDIHDLDGTPTQIPQKRTDADPRLSHPDHRDRLLSYILIVPGDSQNKNLLENHNKAQDIENKISNFYNYIRVHEKKYFILHTLCVVTRDIIGVF